MPNAYIQNHRAMATSLPLGLLMAGLVMIGIPVHATAQEYRVVRDWCIGGPGVPGHNIEALREQHIEDCASRCMELENCKTFEWRPRGSGVRSRLFLERERREGA